jgi:hypothetical protein
MFSDRNAIIVVIKHFLVFWLPRVIALTIIKNIDTSVSINDSKLAIILHHQGLDLIKNKKYLVNKKFNLRKNLQEPP